MKVHVTFWQPWCRFHIHHDCTTGYDLAQLQVCDVLLRRHVGSETFLSSFSGMLTKREVRWILLPCTVDHFLRSEPHS